MHLIWIVVTTKRIQVLISLLVQFAIGISLPWFQILIFE